MNEDTKIEVVEGIDHDSEVDLPSNFKRTADNINGLIEHAMTLELNNSTPPGVEEDSDECFEAEMDVWLGAHTALERHLARIEYILEDSFPEGYFDECRANAAKAVREEHHCPDCGGVVEDDKTDKPVGSA
jgi:hypothetical protein